MELEIGVEVTVYFPMFSNFRIDNVTGSVIGRGQKIIAKTGEKTTVKITKIRDGRIIAEKIASK